DHPNIVKALDGEVTQRYGYLAMEYLGGSDLRKLLAQVGRFPVAQACEYARQAALGLQHAHEHGLVHRDVKPANLLVSAPGGRVKILDLGLVRRQPSAMTGRESDLAATWEGSLVGTADYMAPEQARNPRSVDIRADLYSLGCTLYELIAGRPPFDGG